MTLSRTILLIRHAETDSAGTFCGHADPPLNERGRQQMERLRAELKDEPIKAVFSSDLQRASATADLIAKDHALPLQILPDLREIGFGDWESCTWAEIEAKDADYARRWLEDFPRLPAPGGEAFESFERRVLKAFDLVAAADQNAAIVTHAGVLRTILTRRCGMSDDAAWVQTKAYCGVFRFIGAGGAW